MPSNPSNESTLIPLYLQISESISREIAAGRFVEGDRLPPERELAHQFGTTVRTLRKSLAELEKQGMLERVQGSGNYVRDSDLARGIYSMFRLELPHGGGLPTAQILSLKELDKPVDLPQFGSSVRATRVRRLRCLDQMAVAIEEIWLDRSAGEIDVATLGDSLYRYYQLRLGFWVHRAEDRVSIAALPEWMPDSFGMKKKELCGFVERYSWAQQPVPVEFSRTWFNPHKARYVQRLK
ncbi:GntR family transcriptional regulator [Chromatiales bacterium (ex Bugula neritina AB1)]|nr:GntR family transcriptional regulator [Chromatiales bacterium (ex Bugula neritina AB1)]